jgi:hypothetical protein
MAAPIMIKAGYAAVLGRDRRRRDAGHAHSAVRHAGGEPTMGGLVNLLYSAAFGPSFLPAALYRVAHPIKVSGRSSSASRPAGAAERPHPGRDPGRHGHAHRGGGQRVRRGLHQARDGAGHHRGPGGPVPDVGKLIIIMIAVFLPGWPPAIMLVFLPIVLTVVETLQLGMNRLDLLIWFGAGAAVRLRRAQPPHRCAITHPRPMLELHDDLATAERVAAA